MDMRLVFMGTPDFAVPALVELQRSFQIAGVVTQPDRPAGRGRQTIPSAVKLAAIELALEVYQPQDTNSPPALEQIKSWQPDLICVAAFGQILSPELLAVPRLGCLNLHASLLPRWRGAAPINAAILAGDSKTGVTIMKMAAGLDDGPILSQHALQIGPDDTAGTLSARLAETGARLLAETIPGYAEGSMLPRPQDPALVTYARMLTKGDGSLDFSQTAVDLARKVRAFTPWPGTFSNWKGQRLIIHKARALSVTSPGGGVFLTWEGLPAVGTADGILVLLELQLAGKKRLPGADFLRGLPGWPES